jgi:hypothetical protein
MASSFTLKFVTTPAYHLWLDALHARELARKTTDDWNRGTYVRWTITSAWTVLEMSCKEALNDKHLGKDFTIKLNAALRRKGLSTPDWKTGTWENVAELKKIRNYYTHENASQRELWPDITKAEEAIITARAAVKDIYTRVGIAYPEWINDEIVEGYK